MIGIIVGIINGINESPPAKFFFRVMSIGIVAFIIAIFFASIGVYSWWRILTIPIWVMAITIITVFIIQYWNSGMFINLVLGLISGLISASYLKNPGIAISIISVLGILSLVGAIIERKTKWLNILITAWGYVLVHNLITTLVVEAFLYPEYPGYGLLYLILMNLSGGVTSGLATFGVVGLIRMIKKPSLPESDPDPASSSP
ncbi:hypothetical protein ACFL24_01645 [Patescibacteria group bacterium]